MGMRKIKDWGKSAGEKGRMIYGEKKSSRTTAEGLQRKTYNKCGEIAVSVLHWCIFFNKNMDLKAVEANWLVVFTMKNLNWKKLESTSEQE